jgi:Protein of unknown function (DUF2846)
VQNQKSFLANIALLIATVFLNGCASFVGGTRFLEEAPPKDNEALLYIFRPFSMSSTLLSASFYWDDRFLVSLGLNDYTVVRATPGKHKIAVEQPFAQPKGSYPEPQEFEIAGGRKYRMTLKLVQDGVRPAGMTMTPIIVGKNIVPIYSQTGGPRMVHKWVLEEATDFDQELKAERKPVLRRAEIRTD